MDRAQTRNKINTKEEIMTYCFVNKNKGTMQYTMVISVLGYVP